jgi:Flp pilus assembly protein TadB
MRPAPMRLALVLATSLALLAPASAFAGPKSRNNRCDWIARELVHADAMKERAAKIDDQLGVDKFAKRVQSLEDHFAEKCPEQAAERQSAQQFAALLKTAASAALSYFTLGAY